MMPNSMNKAKVLEASEKLREAYRKLGEAVRMRLEAEQAFKDASAVVNDANNECAACEQALKDPVAGRPLRLMDFGVVGDGVTDDTDGVLRFINASGGASEA